MWIIWGVSPCVAIHCCVCSFFGRILRVIMTEQETIHFGCWVEHGSFYIVMHQWECWNQTGVPALIIWALRVAKLTYLKCVLASQISRKVGYYETSQKCKQNTKETFAVSNLLQHLHSFLALFRELCSFLINWFFICIFVCCYCHSFSSGM